MKAYSECYKHEFVKRHRKTVQDLHHLMYILKVNVHDSVTDERLVTYLFKPTMSWDFIITNFKKLPFESLRQYFLDMFF